VSPSGSSLLDQLWRAVVLLLATAGATWLAWQLLKPMLPVLLVAGVVILGVRTAIFGGRRRRW
jgi:hypothetical protein